MRITIRFLLNFFIPVDVEPSLTIGDVKAHMERTEGVLVAHQKIIFGGKQRTDEMTISECEMKEGDVVHLILKMPHPEPLPPKMLEQQKQHLAAMYATGPPTSAPQAVVPVTSLSSTTMSPAPLPPAESGKKKETPAPKKPAPKAAPLATKKATATTAEKGGKRDAPKKPTPKATKKQ